MQTSPYFDARRVKFNDYENFKLPQYLFKELPADKNAKILDIGSGPGHFLKALKSLGWAYNNIYGVDIDEYAVENSVKNGLNVKLIKDLLQYLQEDKEKFDFIIMSHLIEHLKKEQVIPILKLIYENKLNKDGKLYIATPNAQSLIGSYWAYEDWTHDTIFTSGSLYYVLYMAGFRNIKFIDIYSAACSKKIYMPFRLVAFKICEAFIKIRNKLFFNLYHKPSQLILTWEIKAIAKK